MESICTFVLYAADFSDTLQLSIFKVTMVDTQYQLIVGIVTITLVSHPEDRSCNASETSVVYYVNTFVKGARDDFKVLTSPLFNLFHFILYFISHVNNVHMTRSNPGYLVVVINVSDRGNPSSKFNYVK